MQASASTSRSRMPCCLSRQGRSSRLLFVLGFRGASGLPVDVEPACEWRKRSHATHGHLCPGAVSNGVWTHAQVACPSSVRGHCSIQTLMNRYSVRLSWAFVEQVHAGYVMFWALLSPCYYWSEMGGMFHGPAQSVEKAKGLKIQSGSFDSLSS